MTKKKTMKGNREREKQDKKGASEKGRKGKRNPNQEAGSEQNF